MFRSRSTRWLRPRPGFAAANRTPTSRPRCARPGRHSARHRRPPTTRPSTLQWHAGIASRPAWPPAPRPEPSSCGIAALQSVVVVQAGSRRYPRPKGLREELTPRRDQFRRERGKTIREPFQLLRPFARDALKDGAGGPVRDRQPRRYDHQYRGPGEVERSGHHPDDRPDAPTTHAATDTPIHPAQHRRQAFLDRDPRPPVADGDRYLELAQRP